MSKPLLVQEVENKQNKLPATHSFGEYDYVFTKEEHNAKYRMTTSSDGVSWLQAGKNDVNNGELVLSGFVGERMSKLNIHVENDNANINNKRIITTSDIDSLTKQLFMGKGVPLGSSDDLNSIVEMGVYYIATGVKNSPTDWAVLEIFGCREYCIQRVTRVGGSVGFIRSTTNISASPIVWSAWDETSPLYFTNRAKGDGLGYTDGRPLSGEDLLPNYYFKTGRMNGLCIQLFDRPQLDSGGTQLPNGLYHVITTAPWHDFSGGIKQIAMGGHNSTQYVRHSVNGTTWGKWEKVATTTKSQLSLLNGWTDFFGTSEPATISRTGNVVTIKACIKGGTYANGTAMFTVPTDCIPSTTQTILIDVEDGSWVASRKFISIYNDGRCVTNGVHSNVRVTIYVSYII